MLRWLGRNDEAEQTSGMANLLDSVGVSLYPPMLSSRFVRVSVTVRILLAGSNVITGTDGR